MATSVGLSVLGSANLDAAKSQNAGDLYVIAEALGLSSGEITVGRCFDCAIEECLSGNWEVVGKHRDAIDQLIDENGDTFLKRAVKSGDSLLVKGLLMRGFGYSEEDQKGETALHIACKKDFSYLIPYLLRTDEMGNPLFSPNKRNSEDKTALHIAIERGNIEIVNSLMRFADINLQSQGLSSLLHLAVASEQFQVVSLLLSTFSTEISCLIQTVDGKGRTPLLVAAELDQPESIFLLSRRGAKISDKDRDGNTPLHLACRSNGSYAVEALIALGADTLTRNNNGKKPDQLISENSAAGRRLSSRFGALELDRELAKNQEIRVVKNLVFQGGGPKGIGYISVIEKLEEKKILDHIERVAGASAGAITGALIAVGFSAAEVNEELARQVDGEPIFTKFLDYPAALESESEQLLEMARKGPYSYAFENGVSWKSVVRGLKSGIFGAAKLALSPEKKSALKETYKLGGLCKGDYFLSWMEALIAKATGIENCTFKELRELIPNPPNGRVMKHLYMVGTRIGENPATIEINSEDPEWDDVVISHAIRLSMSIPFAFRPHQIHRKKPNGEVVACPDEGLFVDGGYLNNFMIGTFDKNKFKNSSLNEKYPDDAWTNRYTLGCSLYDPEEEKKYNRDIVAIGKQMAQIALDSEMIRKLDEEGSRNRMIRIDNQGIGLLEFNVDPGKRERILLEAAKKTEEYFKDYSFGRLANLDSYYNWGSFQERQRLGTINLSHPSPHFSGRKVELDALENFLTKPRSETSIIAITGERGYGKSELASAFAALHLEKFPLIWKIDFRNRESLDLSYRKLGQALGVAKAKELKLEDLKAKINQKLENYPSQWLLIFDNVDCGEEVETPKKGGAVLITSADRKRFERGEVIELGKWANGGEIFLESILGPQEKIQELAMELQNIPLLLLQAAKYIESEAITPEQYLRLLKEKGVGSDSSYLEISRGCWEIASKGLKKHYPDAYEWLQTSVFLDNQSIPKSWVAKFQSSIHKEHDSSLQYKRAKEILDFLQQYGLIASQKMGETYSLHGYFQEMVRSGVADQKPCVEKLLELALEFDEINDFNPTLPQQGEEFEKVFSHMMIMLRKAEELEISTEEYGRLGLKAMRYLIEWKRNPGEAKQLVEELHNLKNGIVNHPREGRWEYFLGQLASKEGRYQEERYKDALNHYQKAHTIYSQHPRKLFALIEQNPEKCSREYQMSIALLEQGQMHIKLKEYARAEEKFQASWELLEYLCDEEPHFDKARILRGKGEILSERDGKHKEAVAKMDEAIKMQKQVYGAQYNSHKTAAATLCFLAKTYEGIGTHEAYLKADKTYQNAIEINQRALQTRFHPYIKRIYQNRLRLAQKMGDEGLQEEIKNKIAKITNEES